MPSNAKLYGGGLAALIAGVLVWWFWGDLSGSLWWRIATLALIAIVCFRWAKSKNKGLASNIGNAALIAMAVVVMVSAPGRTFGGWFDSKANAAAEHGVSSLVSSGCPDEHKVKAGDEFVLSLTCGGTKVRTVYGSNLRFHITDPRFSGADFDQWVDTSWQEAGLRRMTVLRWPEGATEVTVQVVTLEQAAEIDRSIASARAAESERAAAARVLNPLFATTTN
jgi:hypothetical protein